MEEARDVGAARRDERRGRREWSRERKGEGRSLPGFASYRRGVGEEWLGATRMALGARARRRVRAVGRARGSRRKRGGGQWAAPAWAGARPAREEKKGRKRLPGWA